jgi:hypothetical protein
VKRYVENSFSSERQLAPKGGRGANGGLEREDNTQTHTARTNKLTNSLKEEL